MLDRESIDFGPDESLSVFADGFHVWLSEDGIVIDFAAKQLVHPDQSEIPVYDHVARVRLPHRLAWDLAMDLAQTEGVKEREDAKATEQMADEVGAILGKHLKESAATISERLAERISTIVETLAESRAAEILEERSGTSASEAVEGHGTGMPDADEKIPKPE